MGLATVGSSTLGTPATTLEHPTSLGGATTSSAVEDPTTTLGSSTPSGVAAGSPVEDRTEEETAALSRPSAGS